MVSVKFIGLVCLLAVTAVFGATQSKGTANSTNPNSEALVRVPESVDVGFFQFDGYHMVDESGRRSGYGYDFLEMASRYCDVSYNFVGYDKSWSDMLTMLTNGDIDLVTSATWSEDRAKLYDYSESSIGTSTGMLTVKAGNTNYSNGIYTGMRVGLIKGNSRNAQFATLMNERGYTYESTDFDTMDDLTSALQDGTNIDAIVTSNLRKTNNEWILEEFNPLPFYVIVKKGSPLIETIDYAISKMDTNDPSWRSTLFNDYYAVDNGDEVDFTYEERQYLESLKESGKPLVTTMNPDSAPYSYFKDGKPMGILPTLFEEAASRMGISYTIVEPKDREEYYSLIENGGLDIVMDYVSDFYLAEESGYKITDALFSTQIAQLSLKKSSSSPSSLAQPFDVREDPDFNALYEGKYVTYFDSVQECVDKVKSGDYDASYLPTLSVQYYVDSDPTNQLKMELASGYRREYSCAVSNATDYLLLSCLNKSGKSLSDAYIQSVVDVCVAELPIDTSLLAFIYDYPGVVAMICAFLVILVAITLFLCFYAAIRRKQKEKQMELDWFVRYICSVNQTILDVDLEGMTYKRYGIDKDGKVSTTEDSYSLNECPDSASPVLEHDYDVLHPGLTATDLDKIIEEGKNLYFEAKSKDGEGSIKWYTYLIQPVAADKKRPKSFIFYRHDIDEAKKEEEHQKAALSDALLAAQGASQAKGNFLSRMSHEIRTPLNAVIGYISIAKDSEGDWEKVNHCIENGETAARHLLKIINDVLDMSSIESGKVKIASDPFDIKELIGTTTSIFYTQAKLKGISFRVFIHDLEYESLIGDQLRLNQVLINLISNALKFTPDNGRVILDVTQLDVIDDTIHIRFSVKDSGIGMSKEYMDRIFTPFEQESSGTAQKFGGTGLGLSIAKNLVTLMKGTLDVDSTQGIGTEFMAVVPFVIDRTVGKKAAKKEFSLIHCLVVDDDNGEGEYVMSLLDHFSLKGTVVHDGESAIKSVVEKEKTDNPFDIVIMDWNMPGLNGIDTAKMIREKCSRKIPIIIATAYDTNPIIEEANRAGVDRVVSKPLFQSTLVDMLVNMCGGYDPKPVSSNDVVYDFSGLKVLIAEDNAMNLEIATELLKKAGMLVTGAEDGKAAVDTFLSSEKGTYDIILMDVQMPIMDGYQATKAIRSSEHPEARSIPIVAMTANAFKEDVSEALSMGMDDHVAKPIDIKRLYAVIARLTHREGKD